MTHITQNAYKDDKVYITMAVGHLHRTLSDVVSNAWVTCPFVGNNFEKLKLIPHTLLLSHDERRKDGL